MILRVNKLKIILFDWDNTLAETRSALVASVNQVLSENHLPEWDAVKDRRDRNLSFRDNFSVLFGARGEELYRSYKIIYLRKIRSLLSTFDCVPETLAYLKSRGIKIAVMTNKDRELFDYEMPLLFDPSLFIRTVCGHEAPRDKPFPEHALYTLNGLIAEEDISPEHVWIVGDSAQDSDCAKAAGVLPIRIGKPIWTPDLPDEPGTVYFNNFCAFLREISQS